MERLDKLLAATGRWSRKEAKALVKAGRVRVAGVLPQGPEDKVTPGTPVTVDGRLVETETFTYLMLHKPAGVVSATEDSRYPVVTDLIKTSLRKDLFPNVSCKDDEQDLQDRRKHEHQKIPEDRSTGNCKRRLCSRRRHDLRTGNFKDGCYCRRSGSSR